MFKSEVHGVDNPYQCFSLPIQADVDPVLLEQRYQERIQETHPDRFVHASESERLLALRRSSQFNDAYHTLKSPVLRFRCLLKLYGFELEPEKHTTLPQALLIQQLEWQESLAEAKSNSDVAASECILQDISRMYDVHVQNMLETLNKCDWPEACSLWYVLSFLDKLLLQVRENIHRMMV